MRKLLLAVSIILIAGCQSRFSGCPMSTVICEYQDPIMLKYPRSNKVVVCNPDANALLEDCARAYENQGFVRLREYPMYVPGSIRIDDKYYSSSY